GEGLYYAMRSGDLAARALVSEKPEAYRWLLRRDFSADLEFSSRLARTIYLGKFLLGTVPARIVQFTRRSPRFSAFMQDVIGGTQSYLGMKKRLLGNLNGSLYEIAMNTRFAKLLPGGSRT